MGRIAIDLIGQKFSRLKVLERAGKDKKGHVLWLCQCECGKTTIVRSKLLRDSHTRSCGCLAKKMLTNTVNPKAGWVIFGGP